jgi:hypothetical protein
MREQIELTITDNTTEFPYNNRAALQEEVWNYFSSG